MLFGRGRCRNFLKLFAADGIFNLFYMKYSA